MRRVKLAAVLALGAVVGVVGTRLARRSEHAAPIAPIALPPASITATAHPAADDATSVTFAAYARPASGDKVARIEPNAARKLRPIPLVRAAFDGEAALARVDTGANVQGAAAWLVRRTAAPVDDAGATSEDHVGAELRLAVTSADYVSIEGWGPLAPGRLVVVDERDDTKSALSGIAVTLSPQRLAEAERPARVVVLDLAHDELRATSEEEAERLLATRAHDIGLEGMVRPCNGMFFVETTVERVPATLLVDTGAALTTLDATSRAAKALASSQLAAAKENGRGEALSGDVATTTFAGVDLRVGSFVARGDVDVLARREGYGKRCGNDGALGYDVLRACVLVFGPGSDTLRARCGAG